MRCIVHVIRWAILVCTPITSTNICTYCILTITYIFSGTFVNILSIENISVQDWNISKHNCNNSPGMIGHQCRVYSRQGNCIDMSHVYFHTLPSISYMICAPHTRLYLIFKKKNGTKVVKTNPGHFRAKQIESHLRRFDCCRSNGIQFHRHNDKSPNN